MHSETCLILYALEKKFCVRIDMQVVGLHSVKHIENGQMGKKINSDNTG